MSPIRDAILRMKAYIPGEQPTESGLIKLNANENPYPPSPHVATAISEAASNLRLYPDSTSEACRNAAARLYGVRPGEVMFTNSSDEMLRILCQSCLDPGDRVACFEPTFPYYLTLAAVQGAECLRIPFPDDYRFPPLPDLSRVKLVFLPNPNAPSGTVFPERDIRTLLESAPDALVVVDEAYADFSGTTSIPLLEDYPHLVVTRTFSKSYSLAGLRVGVGIARESVLRELDKVRDYYNMDRLAQAAAVAALEDQPHLQTHVRQIVTQRERLTAGLREMGVHVWPSGANFILARFSTPTAPDVLAMLRARGILVRYWNAPRLDDCLRITIGSEEQTDRVLDAFREILPPAMT